MRGESGSRTHEDVGVVVAASHEIQQDFWSVHLTQGMWDSIRSLVCNHFFLEIAERGNGCRQHMHVIMNMLWRKEQGQKMKLGLGAMSTQCTPD
ncbi:hypothetical protein Bca52824_073451 [Brassica carinata]|uniref:Uncharacterized protein n=1 Tax=Brassica carinata TaxID=52824 RepID=A0A8X7U593_BRACI|nr:hypothetical protein Bca52824_073451 [Brassica carinata]